MFSGSFHSTHQKFFTFSGGSEGSLGFFLFPYTSPILPLFPLFPLFPCFPCFPMFPHVSPYFPVFPLRFSLVCREPGFRLFCFPHPKPRRSPAGGEGQAPLRGLGREARGPRRTPPPPGRVAGVMWAGACCFKPVFLFVFPFFFFFCLIIFNSSFSSVARKVPTGKTHLCLMYVFVFSFLGREGVSKETQQEQHVCLCVCVLLFLLGGRETNRSESGVAWWNGVDPSD